MTIKSYKVISYKLTNKFMLSENQSLFAQNESNKKIRLIGMSKTVKFLAAIDIFFSL